MPYQALHELLQLVAAEPNAGEVEIEGDDPVFRTPFRIGAAGAAAIAAAAVAAARLWALRTGRHARQAIGIDLRHAAAALRSTRYLRINGVPPRDPIDRLSGLYPARGQRWVFLHCNFPNHRAAALGVLGLSAEAGREAVEQAVHEWDGLALEEAIHAARGCAALVRTAAEWSSHPQSSALAALPVVEIERIGEAPPESLAAAERPLAGIRVLDLTRVLAGPTCARALAEHGADVLKISALHLPHSGDVEIDTGLGKLSAFLDLGRATDADLLTSLIRNGRCDVFSQSYRPGTLAARGFGPATLAKLRPGIVCVELSAWGSAGPWSERRGFDTVVQCVSGMAMIQGGGDAPRIMPVSAIDYVSGYLMAFGAMVALERRAREGGSWRVRVSLARTGRWIAERGVLDAAQVASTPAELPDDVIAQITRETASPLGRVRHVAPVARMSETPACWARPPVPLGHDAPAWP